MKYISLPPDESPPVNCREFNQCITPAVDNRLSKENLTQFLDHAMHCPKCKRDYEGERRICALVRSRIRSTRVPPVVVSSILSQLKRESALSSAAWHYSLERILRSPRAKFFAALSISSVVVLFLIVPPRLHQSSITMAGIGPNDVILQSISNYHAVLKGEFVPQVMSDRPERVRTFFNGKTEFPVFIPVMKECTLIGGVVNDFHGMRLAHVVYKHGQQTIYLYQACRESVMKGDKLKISAEVKTDLERTGWHCCTAPDGAAIVLWARGNTLCAAVSAMKGDHLMAHLVDGDIAGAW